MHQHHKNKERRCEMEQRTAEWFQARLGKVTASNVYNILSKTAKGLPTSKYEDYKTKLMTERLIEGISQSYTTQAMQWGIEHEENALREYEFIYDTEVTRYGFIPHPKMKMAGASPDGFIGEDGLIEVKCHNQRLIFVFLCMTKSSLNISHRCNSKWHARGEMVSFHEL